MTVSKIKKSKIPEKVCHKKETFENYKNYQETTQLDNNKINYLEKNEISIVLKEIMKNS